jgi:hypothetical protein
MKKTTAASRYATLFLVAAIVAAITGALLACGPFLIDLVTVQPVEPPHRVAYARGNLGVVRPRFARKYLVQAYRRLTGRPPLANTVKRTAEWEISRTVWHTDDESPRVAWLTAAAAVVKAPPDANARPLDQERRLANYNSIQNCNDDAFMTAVATLKARIGRFGPESSEAVDWVRAQTAVFRNCNGADQELFLPDAAPPSADPLVLADRAYQTAAAYFYAMRYDEALQRFRAIAEDTTSPWRKYGRYLAARSEIRMALMAAAGAASAAQLAAAESDLKAVLTDAMAVSLHSSARGLLDFVTLRARPIEQLHRLSRAVGTEPAVSDQVLFDFQRAMDNAVGDAVDYPYASIRQVNEVIQDDDLVDWITAIQGDGEQAPARALTQWKRTRSTLWLVAALWKLPPAHPEAPEVLHAAEEVARTSPGFETIAFLRVRMLMAQNRRDDARRVLASLPIAVSEGAQPETINLLRAQRFQLARTFDELLGNASRTIVTDDLGPGSYSGGRPIRSATEAQGQPTFDEDAALVFSYQLPLDRLVDASRARTLPPRLRVRVAVATFTRAVLLDRPDAALAVTPGLRSLAPQLASDLDRYTAAAPADRHREAIRLLLRTPGMHASVQGLDDDMSYEVGEPSRRLDYILRRDWWCAAGDPATRRNDVNWPWDSALIALLGTSPGPPDFLTAAERSALAREMKLLAAIGPAPDYLAREAINWARTSPTDIDAAEALARAVAGARSRCEGLRKRELSRQAFQLLHRLFPQSPWAKQTKYWY